ncbi:MAG: type 4b pilus protein PilO2 [Cytophagales bacterium]|nr:type 4b pilus protein PilO2 [Cytophagales bacterium]
MTQLFKVDGQLAVGGLFWVTASRTHSPQVDFAERKRTQAVEYAVYYKAARRVQAGLAKSDLALGSDKALSIAAAFAVHPVVTSELSKKQQSDLPQVAALGIYDLGKIGVLLLGTLDGEIRLDIIVEPSAVQPERNKFIGSQRTNDGQVIMFGDQNHELTANADVHLSLKDLVLKTNAKVRQKLMVKRMSRYNLRMIAMGAALLAVVGVVAYTKYTSYIKKQEAEEQAAKEAQTQSPAELYTQAITSFLNNAPPQAALVLPVLQRELGGLKDFPVGGFSLHNVECQLTKTGANCTAHYNNRKGGDFQTLGSSLPKTWQRQTASLSKETASYAFALLWPAELAKTMSVAAVRDKWPQEATFTDFMSPAVFTAKSAGFDMQFEPTAVQGVPNGVNPIEIKTLPSAVLGGKWSAKGAWYQLDFLQALPSNVALSRFGLVYNDGKAMLDNVDGLYFVRR